MLLLGTYHYVWSVMDLLHKGGNEHIIHTGVQIAVLVDIPPIMNVPEIYASIRGCSYVASKKIAAYQ